MFRRIVFMFVLSIVAACGSAYAWDIESYRVNVDLVDRHDISVAEEIVADFGYEQKHGIFRDIPTAYQDEQGRALDIRFRITAVEDGRGAARRYTQNVGTNVTQVRIGDPSLTVSGRQTYVIRYVVSGALRSFP